MRFGALKVQWLKAGKGVLGWGMHEATEEGKRGSDCFYNNSVLLPQSYALQGNGYRLARVLCP